MSALAPFASPRAIVLAALACWLCACAGAVDPEQLPDGFGQPMTPDRGLADRALDHASPDAPAAVDARPPDVARKTDLATADARTDAPPPPPLCAPLVDSATLALYRFEGSGAAAADDTGQHPAALVGSGVSRVATGGMPGCGKALAFTPTSPPSYLRIDDAPAWDLASGSFDLWVRFAGDAADIEGVLSRDASGTSQAGHVSLYRVCTGALVLRLQEIGADHFLCTSPVAGGAWHHVGVNFGPAGVELLVDGAPATHAQPISCSGIQEIACGSGANVGIAGNDNPWVLGGLSWTSADGAAEPVTHAMAGHVDALRISNAPRSFSAPL